MADEITKTIYKGVAPEIHTQVTKDDGTIWVQKLTLPKINDGEDHLLLQKHGTNAITYNYTMWITISYSSGSVMFAGEFSTLGFTKVTPSTRSTWQAVRNCLDELGGSEYGTEAYPIAILNSTGITCNLGYLLVSSYQEEGTTKYKAIIRSTSPKRDPTVAEYFDTDVSDKNVTMTISRTALNRAIEGL